MKNFRKAIFDLCKIIKADKKFDFIQNEMKNITSENTKDPIIALDYKKTTLQTGVQLNCEFHGILFAFENELPIFCTKERIDLTTEEYYALAYGHSLILNFIDKCLSDIKKISPSIASALSPYALIKPIQNIDLVFNFDSSIFDESVNIFKSTKVYKHLMQSNILTFFKNLSDSDAKHIVAKLDSTIIKSHMDIVPENIGTLRQKEILHTQLENEEALQIILYHLLALREILDNAVKLIYSSLVREELVVFNEDNLIDIEKSVSNFIYNYKTIQVQGFLGSSFVKIVKHLILLHIENDDETIHDFGVVHNATISYSKDEGSSTKLTYCIVDEELNPISNLTDNHTEPPHV